MELSTLLLDREQELGLLEELLSGDRRETSRLAVVEGPAGIGKSRLLAALRERAGESGFRVVAANGSDLERDFPFGVVRQLFEQLVVTAQANEQLLDGAAAAAGSVFESPGSDAGGEEDASFAALHGLYWLTVNLASEQPLMLVVDDLHWCDRPSLRFLAYLARRLEGLDALLVVGLRSAEPGTDPVMIGDIVGNPDATAVHPGPLSEAGVTELIRSLLEAEPEPGFVAACRTATGGNPLLLRQLLSSLVADGVRPEAAEVEAVRQVGPRAVSRTVLTRLRRLAPEATIVAQSVAVLGTHAELPLVSALAGIDEPVVAKAMAALARAEILRIDPPVGFVHPLVRDAVYHELPPGERALLHAKAAQLLLDVRASPEAVATQLLAAPRRSEMWVVALLRDAATRARHKGAAESAVAYLERALQEPPPEQLRSSVLLELGMAETLISGPAAATHLREAWHLLEDPSQRAHVAATLARVLLFTAPAEEALAVAKRALAETPAELADERQALLALELMAVFFGAPGQEEMTRLDEVAITGAGPGAKMLAAITSFCRALTGAPAEECVPLATDALADGVLIDVDPGLFPVAAIIVLVLADRDEALLEWDRLRERAHRGGSLLGILTVGLWGGFTLLWRGDLLDAEESLDGTQRDFVSWGLVQSSETYVPAFLGLVYLRRGNLAGARELLLTDIEDPRTDGYRHLLTSRAELLLAEGRFEEALAIAEDLAERLAFIEHPGWSTWRSLKARALDALARTDEALELARHDLERARRWGSAGVVGRALGLVGRLEREDGIDDLRQAVELLERSTATYDLAQTQLALGAALRRTRRPSDAREPLRHALEIADRCGAERLADEARAELRAAGARPRAAALRGVQALTASERRVADLAVEGRTNKEIAQALYVTPKTVEVHLSNAYRKLEIGSRQELGRAMAASGATAP